MPRPSFREFNDPNPPEIIYFDTSFVLETLVKGQCYHEQCKNFIKRLETKQPIVIFSELLKAELWCGTIAICVRNRFGQDVNVRQVIDQHPKLIRHYDSKAVRIQKDFVALLQRFKDWTSIELSEEISIRAHLLMPKYCLGSYDAIHIATMEEWGIKDIAVFDKHIENIPNIRIWSVDAVSRYINRKRLGRTLE